ncbi:MAG: Rieske 2Fe-2S domain-containing protein [Acidimicrobiia bacterium]|nr:Rieske 2Fe-2S domain-containing protein [Acidimicrobiia bacterium]
MPGVRVPIPAPGEVLRVAVEGEAVALWNVEGELHAIGDVCPHRGFVLSEGMLERHPDRVCVVCPGHFWRYDIRTGEHLAGPERVRTFVVTEVDGMAEIVPGPVTGGFQ